jgi:hypothetical protein
MRGGTPLCLHILPLTWWSVRFAPDVFGISDHDLLFTEKTSQASVSAEESKEVQDLVHESHTRLVLSTPAAAAKRGSKAGARGTAQGKLHRHTPRHKKETPDTEGPDTAGDGDATTGSASVVSVSPATNVPDTTSLTDCDELAVCLITTLPCAHVTNSTADSVRICVPGSDSTVLCGVLQPASTVGPEALSEYTDSINRFSGCAGSRKSTRDVWTC